MGWANCGSDSKGRPIGYAHEATCDFPGCNNKIDRGLAYACGGMHGNSDGSCENYFCPEHLEIVEDIDGETKQLCFECAKYHYENQFNLAMEIIAELGKEVGQLSEHYEIRKQND